MAAIKLQKQKVGTIEFEVGEEKRRFAVVACDVKKFREMAHAQEHEQDIDTYIEYILDLIPGFDEDLFGYMDISTMVQTLQEAIQISTGKAMTDAQKKTQSRKRTKSSASRKKASRSKR